MMLRPRFSSEYSQLWGNEARSLDIQQYEYCANELIGKHEKGSVRCYILAILLFIVGLWAVAEREVFVAVLLLALAYNYNRQSAHHALAHEIINTNRLLAMLINGQKLK